MLVVLLKVACQTLSLETQRLVWWAWWALQEATVASPTVTTRHSWAIFLAPVEIAATAGLAVTRMVVAQMMVPALRH